MLETGRFIVLYISLIVIQVYSHTNLKISTISRNKNPLVVFIDSKTHQIRYYEVESKDTLNNIMHVNEEKDTNEFNNYKSEENHNDMLVDKMFSKDVVDEDIGVLNKNEQNLEETAKERAKYLFYNFLRTSPDEDSEFQDTRHYLRQALRARCIKVLICIKKCKVTKPKCPEKCQQELDREDLCEPPKAECEKPSCGWGKTMPPKWLL